MNSNNEQLIHDLEQRHLSLRREHESLKADRDCLHEKVNSQQKRIDELTITVENSSRQQLDKEFELKRKDNTIKELEQSNEDIRERLHRRSEECDRLRDDIKSQAEQLITHQSRLKEVSSTLSELQGQQLPLQYEFTKITRENEILKSRNIWCEQELQEKHEEILKMKSNLLTKISSLENELSDKTSEHSKITEKYKQLEDQSTIQIEKIEQYITTIRELEINIANEKDAFLREIDAQKKLVNIYKHHLTSAESKLEDITQELSALQEVHKDRLNQQLTRHDKQVNDLKSLIEQMRNDYEKQIQELDMKLQETMSHRGVINILDTPSYSIPKSDDTNNTGNTSSTINNLPLSFDGIGITEMYDRVVSIEAELNTERSRRREVEIYLNRVVKDIENKAPIITSQRRDYILMRQSHEKLSQHLEEVLHENHRMREQMQQNDSRVHQAEKEAKESNMHAKDLSAQVQHLLKKEMERTYGKRLPHSSETGYGPGPGPGAGPGVTQASDVISEHLVTFDDITQLQSRNEQLVRTIRKLTEDYEELNRSTVNKIPEETEDTKQELMRELQTMRETRQRHEDMLVRLAQQRDMYKAMLDEADASNRARGSPAVSGSCGSALVTASGGSPTPHAQITAGSPTGMMSLSKMQELQSSITQMEEERIKLIDRLSRIEETEKAMSEALDKSKQELSTLRMEAAHAIAEAKFQSSRASHLELSLTNTQSTLESVISKRAELEGLLVAQQSEMKRDEDRKQHISDSLRTVQSDLRRCEAALEASKQMEQYYIKQISDAREETQKQRSLSDSLMRIEAGLSSRTEEEMASVVRERDQLIITLEKVRKEGNDRILILEQRIMSLEEDIRVARISLEQRDKDAISANEMYLREQTTSKAAIERSAILERQLIDIQNRYDQLQGNRTVDRIVATDTAQTELALERANAEIESLQKQLIDSQTHVDQFRRISITTENILKELRERSEITNKTQEEEIQKLNTQIQSLHTELTEKRQAYMLAIQDSETIRDTLTSTMKEYEEKKKEIETDRDAAVLSQEQANKQMEIIKEDMLKMQHAAKVANANYERELQLHAQAAASIKQLEDELDQIRDERVRLDEKLAEQSSKMIQMESLHEEEKRQMTVERSEYTARLDDLQHTNDLLHNQVQGLGIQVDKLHTGRVDSSSSMSDGARDTTIEEELTEAQHTARQLREVVGYMKRERDTLEAKLSVANTELSRHQSSAMTYQRLLEEVRAELKKELEKNKSTRDDNEFSRIMSEVTQLNIVRESNAHLRAENENLSKQMKTLKESLIKSENEVIPLQQKIRMLETTQIALEKERDALCKDATYWKDRLHQLVSRYNDVDPEEHRQLIAKLELITQTEKKTQENLQKVLDEKAAIQSNMKKELDNKVVELNALKAASERQDKSMDNMRNLLRKKTQDGKDYEKRITEYKKEIAESQQQCTLLRQMNNSQLSKLQQQVEQIKSLNIQLEAATSSVATTATASTSTTSAPAGTTETPSISIAPSTSATTTVTTATITTTRDVTAAPPPTPPPAAPSASASLTSTGSTPTHTPTTGGSTSVPAANETEEFLRQKLMRMRRAPSTTSQASTATVAVTSSSVTTSTGTSSLTSEETGSALGTTVTKTSLPAITSAILNAPADVGTSASESSKETEVIGSADGDSTESGPAAKKMRPATSITETTVPAPPPPATQTSGTIDKMEVVPESPSITTTSSESSTTDTVSITSSTNTASQPSIPPTTTTITTSLPPAKMSAPHGLPVPATGAGGPPTSSRFTRFLGGRGMRRGAEDVTTIPPPSGIPPPPPPPARPIGFGHGIPAISSLSGGVANKLIETPSGDMPSTMQEMVENEKESSENTSLNPDAAEFLPPSRKADSSEDGGELSVDVCSGADEQPPPPATSPFLNIRPPSPASSGKLMFGGKSTGSLPMPSGLPPPSSHASTGGSGGFGGGMLPIKHSGESLFGVGNKAGLPSAFSSSSPSSENTVFGTLSSSSASFLATNQGAVASSGLMGQSRPSTSIFGFVAQGTPVLPVPPPAATSTQSFGSTSAETSSAISTPPSHGFGIFSSGNVKESPPVKSIFQSAHQQLVAQTSPTRAPHTSPSPAETPTESGTSTDGKAEDIQSSSTTAGSAAASVGAPAAAVEEGEVDSDAPVVSLSATKAMSAEERSQKRKAKFAASASLASSGASSSTGGPSNPFALSSQQIRKRSFPQSTSDASGTASNNISSGESLTPSTKIAKTVEVGDDEEDGRARTGTDEGEMDTEGVEEEGDDEN